MIKIENDCVSCAVEPYQCHHCWRERTPHYYCDGCGDETELYEYDGNQYCVNCILDDLKKVEFEEPEENDDYDWMCEK